MPTPATIVHGPALYHLSNDSVLIWWETDIPDGPNKIEWWKTAQAHAFVTATTRTIFDLVVEQERYVHWVHLTGLTANTVHSYKLFAFLFETPEVFAHTFKTYPDDGSVVKVGVWGNNEFQTAAAVPGFQATLSFLDGVGATTYLTTGGIVGDGNYYGNWTGHWLDSLGQDRLGSKGISGARGETDGASQVARAMWPFPEGNEPVSDLVWDHSIGKAWVASVTSVPGDPLRDLRIGRPQGEWLLNRVSQKAAWKDALYRILLVHHPFRTTFWNDSCEYGADGTREDLVQLQELVKLSGADLVLYGYSRSYQRGAFTSTFRNNSHTIHHIVTGGGGAFKHSNRCFSWPAPTEPSILKDSSDYIALTLEVSASRLFIEAHNMETSTVFDSVAIAPHTLF